ncbi:MAG: iviTM7 [Candidatus Saccharibacteria bacterium]|nr:iviTM7 [Candidatus Saccharibacteria bacterium]
MADRLNPAEETVAESDYRKKFNKDPAAEAKELKEKEATPGSEWKTTTTTKKSTDKTEERKGRFAFVGGRAGKVKSGSALFFVIGLIGLGVLYTSVLAPNIILVNIKEMYTNDLSDATIALNDYYWKLMNYKIGQSQCGDKKDIKCKLSTMSRAQKLSFDKHGFTVLGSKVNEDNIDDGQPGNNKTESRYQVSAIIPPASSPGFIATGDMLYLYAQLSSANKALVYGVFNPKSSFYNDTRFKERLKTKYDLSTSISVGGDTEQAVRQSFDSALSGGGEGIGIDGEPNTNGGISVKALANPSSAIQYEVAARSLSNFSSSFIGLQCSWNALGKAVINDAQTAKAHTLARYAMQYLQAADEVKNGTSQDVTIGTLSSNLAQGADGTYNTPNATDSSMYKSITYGSLPVPSIYNFLYNEDPIDIFGALFPSWLTIMGSSAAEGKASAVNGQLVEPPANTGSSERDYCLGGETTQNKNPIREQRCQDAITASAIPGTEGLLAPALEVGRKTCPHPQYDEEDNTYAGTYSMTPAVKATDGILTPLVAGILSANVIAWANAEALTLSSNTKGDMASDAIFAGTGEILGDMAMSRGMEPANAATMGVYLAQKDSVDKQFEDVARYNAQKTPFDIYNQYSFMGSIVHNLAPTYNDKTPLFSTIANSMSFLGDSVKGLNPSANAFYYSQPEIPLIDPTNPAQTTALHAAGLAKYLVRLGMCPNIAYIAIQITADVACNVRYQMGKQELTADPSNVIDYMEKSHSDLTQKNVDELQQRLAQADPEGDYTKVQNMYDKAQGALNQPEIDKETGKPTPNSEYSKFMDYCVNRQDPWGSSGVVDTYTEVSNDQRAKDVRDKQNVLTPISQGDSGDPYARTPNPLAIAPSLSEGASADQDWYTGKKCMEQSDELTNFRAYTMLCSVDGSLSGGIDCTDNDNDTVANGTNDYYSSNDILFISGN